MKPTCWAWSVSIPDEALVVTVAEKLLEHSGDGTNNREGRPLAAYPYKGRGTQGVRVQRFRGEDRLDIAWVGIPWAASADGTWWELPAALGRAPRMPREP